MLFEGTTITYEINRAGKIFRTKVYICTTTDVNSGISEVYNVEDNEFISLSSICEPELLIETNEVAIISIDSSSEELSAFDIIAGLAYGYYTGSENMRKMYFRAISKVNRRGARVYWKKDFLIQRALELKNAKQKEQDSIFFL